MNEFSDYKEAILTVFNGYNPPSDIVPANEFEKTVASENMNPGKGVKYLLTARVIFQSLGRQSLGSPYRERTEARPTFNLYKLEGGDDKTHLKLFENFFDYARPKIRNRSYEWNDASNNEIPIKQIVFSHYIDRTVT